jgi:hypothetical protein
MLDTQKKTTTPVETKAVAALGRWGEMVVIGDRHLLDLAPELIEIEPFHAQD